MDKKILILERSYEAPIAKVWAAITDKEQMKQWYFELNDFKAEVGFEFEFLAENDGKQFLHKCRVLEVEPITKIAYSWRYEGYAGDSIVTFELFSEDKHTTRLKLTHSGTESFLAHADFAKADFNEGWNHILGQSLRNFVEVESFVQSVRIKADVKDIWEILLEPNDQWARAFGDGARVETDWKVGSSIIWRDTDNNIGANGIVAAHQPQAFLQLRYYDDVEPLPEATLGQYSEQYRLKQEQDECLLTIEIGPLAKVDIPSHQQMWAAIATIIKKYSENKTQK